MVSEIPDASLDVVGVRVHANGEPAFIEVRVRRPGTSTKRLALTTQSVLAIDDAERMFRRRHIERWGRIGLQSAADLHTNMSRRHGVMIWYDSTAIDRASLSEAFANVPNTEVYAPPRPPVVVTRLTGRELAEDWSRRPWVNRITLMRSGPQMAMGGVPQGFDIPNASLSSNTDLDYNQRTSADDCDETDPAAFENIFGRGIKVGIVETPDQCGIRDDHDAFSRYTKVDYMMQPLSCTSDSECALQCAQRIFSGTVLGQCKNGQCIAVHPSQVSSRIGAYNNCTNTPGQAGDCWQEFAGCYHASNIELYVANNFPSSLAVGGVPPTTIIDAYEDLDSNQVRIVNESWNQLSDDFTAHSQLTDWYARHRGMTFIQGAQNGPPPGTRPSPLCYSYNNICVGGFRSKRKERTYQLHQLWPYTTWANPQPAARPELFELSKPDVVAHAGGVPIAQGAGQNHALVVNTSDTESWMFGSGNSFAAPVVAGALALHVEDCFGPGATPPPPSDLRARLLLSQWYDQELEFNYAKKLCTPASLIPEDRECLTNGDCNPGENCLDHTLWSTEPGWDTACRSPTPVPSGTTPRFPTDDTKFNCDFKAGTGSVDPGIMRLFCGTHPGSPGSPITGMTGNETAIPGGGDPVDSTGYPIDEVDILNLLTNDTNIQALPAGQNTREQSGARALELFDYGSLAQGSRVRFVMSYNACPGGPMGITSSSYDVGVAVNLDLAICGTTTLGAKECIWISEGGDETNEGFDITLEEDYTEVKTFMIMPANWQPCDDGEGNVQQDEPVSWATLWR